MSLGLLSKWWFWCLVVLAVIFCGAIVLLLLANFLEVVAFVLRFLAKFLDFLGLGKGFMSIGAGVVFQNGLF